MGIPPLKLYPANFSPLLWKCQDQHPLFFKISRVYKLRFFLSHWHPRWFIPHISTRQPDNVLVLITFARFGWSQLKAFASGVLKGLSAKHASKEGVKPCGILHCNQFKPWDLSPPKFIGKRKVRIGAIARNLSKLPRSNSSIWVEGTPRYTNLSGGWIYFFVGKFHHHLKLLETLVKKLKSFNN